MNRETATGAGRRLPDQPAAASPLDGAINERYLTDESNVVAELLERADAGQALRERVRETAVELVARVRETERRHGGLDAFLHKYDLSSQEGVVLMCIAEALLRIPDADTADRLIADKLTSGRWEEHLGSSESLFVNASTWGLMLTGRLMRLDEATIRNPAKFLGKLTSKAGEPVVRQAMRQAMKIMGHQFVMGRDIEEALERAGEGGNRRYRYSYDMLGEAALTAEDAERYFRAYAGAIEAIGGAAGDDVIAAPGISVKLSALHPRYEFTQRGRLLDELVPRLARLTEMARDAGIPLTVDAEEADRLEISLEIFAAVAESTSAAGYDGLGLAVQAYQKRSLPVIRWLAELAGRTGRRIPVRLVKGAYWDTEIKRAQEQGLEGYPVFTRKANTDVSFLACARELLDAGERLYPQFATHNAHTLASILHLAGQRRDYEFQRLHGMGEELYEQVVDPERYDRPCRVYAPVGSHEDLLPYLVRRLLENGANTSFVNRIVDEEAPVEEIVADPVEAVRSLSSYPHPRIPLPAAIYGEERRNSRGLNLADRALLGGWLERMQKALDGGHHARPRVAGRALSGRPVESRNPARTGEVVGVVEYADGAAVDRALGTASAAWYDWNATDAATRANILRRAADLYEEEAPALMALCVAEAGKSIGDSLGEVREAVDFLRYYAARAEALFAAPLPMAGPTGERNELRLQGRGVFVCISPWNFPLAIFTGQVAAALAAGNTVLAKPAEQTSLIAARAVDILHRAGVPGEVLNFLPGEGGEVGAAAVADPRVAGVAFTGSTETARLINRTLAERPGPIAAFIAETGGQNAMLVDSSALPEQVVKDAVYSGYNSAGQRCSALRILCVQRDIAPRVIELLTGHMDELSVGDPGLLSTDVGPVIDAGAQEMLERYVADMGARSSLVHRTTLGEGTGGGTFVAPTAIEIERIDQLGREVFGPVVHIYRYRARDLRKTVEAINATGYGLTMGVHSRIDRRARDIAAWARVGNLYVNRNMIGAVVGAQPFGGQGLSGTGPKAGGPHYLLRFATECSVSNNTAAVGGNATLLSLAAE
ncbi:bifunctional proline dehydrogenase/L-glutamate gamma-semialdehyde dehydrogenase PutA [Lentisalinibacter orientalis]|uniref:bifunctional proline dehydrogenase/L-glutamate gamma-semialdehyde dehydrogenase PutA n=1 Tax=Lentisalinibacter orientalis TaxID=2992241 RepID=UPI003864886D